MRKFLCVAVLATGLVASVLTRGAWAGEEAIPLDKLPKAVVAAVKHRFPKAKMTEAAKETDGKKVEFEVTLMDGATKLDVMLTPDGKITLIEKVIDAKTLPKAVTAALGEKFPKATFKTVEEVITVTDGKETLDFYEVLLTDANAKAWEVKITPAGKITETEDKSKEKKEEKKDK